MSKYYLKLNVLKNVAVANFDCRHNSVPHNILKETVLDLTSTRNQDYGKKKTHYVEWT